MNEDTNTFFTNIFTNSIFKDERIFFRDYIPKNIVCRDDVITKLSLAFKIFLSQAHPINIWISGKPGVGKTTISKYFILNLEKIIQKKTQIKILSFYYNCFMFRKVNSIIYNLLSEKFNQSCRGFETEYLISNLIGILRKKKLNLILILDEVHILNDDLLRILEIGEMYEDKNLISVIFISREEHDREINKLLGGRINNFLKIPPYTKNQLSQIINQRSDLGFREPLAPSIIDLISEIAEKDGNARHAIEILYQAGKICDLEGQNRVTIETVRKAKQQVYPQMEDNIFESLDLHELLALLSIVRRLKHEEEPIVPVRKAYSQYQIICEEYKEKYFAISTYRNKIEHLVKLGFLDKLKLKSKSSNDRIGYSIIESSTNELENKILNILD
ncbi:MAG: hypothetical protein EAX96_10615 [Candidatus Lokiarchaeota archaeon]|nr:hypothetical protein [Candidatus Lokiarchaeota archaeon]